MRSIHRRAWFVAAVAAVAGCSPATSKKQSAQKKGKRSGPPSKKNAEAWNRKHRPQGPQTFDNLLAADSWIKDLDSASPQTRISAAKQLGNMGKSAQSALPKLEQLAKDKDADVAKAARQAIDLIRR